MSTSISTCNNLLKSHIQADCKDPVVKGIEANGIIINRKDIDFASVDFKDTKNVISKLPVKNKGYRIYVPTLAPFTGTTTTMEAGANRNSFTNSVGFVILDNGPEVAEIVDSLATGEYVIVYENKFKGLQKTDKGSSAFQVVGYYQGLKAATLENDKYSDDTEGGWNVVMTETKVPKSALFFYVKSDKTDITSYDLTVKALDEICGEAVKASV